MKRILSLLLVLVLVCGLFPVTLAASAPVISSNLDYHWYVNMQRWASPIYSNLAYENGEYVRAEYIGDELVVEYYDQNFKFRTGKTIELELPIFGGLRMDTDYNFVVVGQTNMAEDDSKEVFRIIRYTKDWQKVDHASIYGANTTVPFDAGSLRFDRSGDILYIRTAHEMYADENGINHQANVMISVRISDMEVTDELTKVWNSSYGYVSHSFNQFVRVDGDTLLAVDHGDYYPRSVALFKYSAKAGRETFYSRTAMVNALPIVSSTYHYNDTGVSVGGFEFSDTHYLIAGSSYHQQASANLMEVHRNIFVTATPKDNFTDEGTVVNWLTDYEESDNVEVSPPHMLKVSANRFLLLWTENDTVKYGFVNGSGQLEGTIKTHSGHLSDCAPIRAGRFAVWYVTDFSAPKFYQIELEPCTHSYTATVTAPTCTAEGYTTHTCIYCSDSYVDSKVPALGHSYGSWYTIQEPSCIANGAQRRDCSRCNAYETATLDPLSHSYQSAVTKPTCTEQGYTTHTCTSCGDSYVDSYVPALDHAYGSWYTIQAPTCTASGTQRRDCSRCNSYETDSMPLVPHSYQSAVTKPTCTEQGYTTHTCTGCGVSYADSYVPALGHSWDAGIVILEPTEEDSGLRQHTCLVCGSTEDRIIPALGHTHVYDSVITEPDCFNQGYTTHTCSCGDSYIDSYTAALGHDHRGTVTAPTCTDDGYTTFVCSRCGDSYFGNYTPALGHDYHGVVTEPTCTDVGYTTFTCSRCSHSRIDNYTVSLGHTYRDYKCIRCAILKPTPFRDVEYGAFYHVPVLWAVDNQITKGVSATEFDPDGYCTRGQVVTFLWRAAGEPKPASGRNPFTDLDPKQFCYEAVLWAVEQGVTNGVSATKFDPDGYCTRGQVVTFLWRAAGKPKPTSGRNPFTDLDPKQFCYEAVLWAVEQGITTGVSATKFDPDAFCTRAQVVTFLYRAKA